MIDKYVAERKHSSFFTSYNTFVVSEREHLNRSQWFAVSLPSKQTYFEHKESSKMVCAWALSSCWNNTAHHKCWNAAFSSTDLHTGKILISSRGHVTLTSVTGIVLRESESVSFSVLLKNRFIPPNSTDDLSPKVPLKFVLLSSYVIDSVSIVKTFAPAMMSFGFACYSAAPVTTNRSEWKNNEWERSVIQLRPF